MAGDIHDYTVLSGLSVPSTGTVVVRGATVPSYISVPSAGSIQLSTGTVVLGAAHVSMRTTTIASLASVAPTNADNGVFGFQLLASGMSLLYRSGNTVYVFNSAGSQAA